MRRYGFAIEIIVTGDEIMFGRITDTNSAWIARRAAELGARVSRVTSVGDDVEEISGVLGETLARSPDLIVLTGGLGPSEDDMTVEAASGRLTKAEALGYREFIVYQTSRVAERLLGHC